MSSALTAKALAPAQIALAARPLAPDPRRERTYRSLMLHAARLISEERIPSVAEVAEKAGVSRATAYRYFPSRSNMIGAVVAQSLAPVREFRSDADAAPQRLREVFAKTLPLLIRYEPHWRAALQLSLAHHALERSGQLREEPFRRGNRREILTRTLEPLRKQLSRPQYDRLIRAISLIFGIEPIIVLKDIWGCSDADAKATINWVLEAIIATALPSALVSVSASTSRTVRRRSRIS